MVPYHLGKATYQDSPNKLENYDPGKDFNLTLNKEFEKRGHVGKHIEYISVSRAENQFFCVSIIILTLFFSLTFSQKRKLVLHGLKGLSFE